MKLVELNEAAETIRGVTFGKSDASSDPLPGYLPVLRAGNISDAIDFRSDLVFVPESLVNKRQLLRAGDIVMCTSSGSASVVGKSAIVDQDWNGSFGAFCATIRPDPRKASPAYVAHFLKTSKFRNWASSSSGVGIKNIRSSELQSFRIPLPPLDEQKRIAAILDQADELRRLRQRAVDRLDSLTHSYFLKFFGDPRVNPKHWAQYPLGKIATKITDGEHLNPTFSDAGMPIVMAGNVGENTVDFNSARCVSMEDGNKFRKKCNPELHDLLIVSRGATIGRLCRVNTSDKFCLMGSVILIKPDTSVINSAYLSRCRRDLCWN